MQASFEITIGSEAEELSWLNKKIVAVIVIIIVGTAIAGIWLSSIDAMFSSEASHLELTNVFTFAIEIGLGIFVAMVLFLYSKQVNDRLESDKKAQREIYLKAVITCLSDIWMKCKLLILNLNLHNLPEVLTEEVLTNIKLEGPIVDAINTNKLQIDLGLRQLNTLTVLLSPLPIGNPELLTSLLVFENKSMKRVHETGTLREFHPWSRMIVEIDSIVKKYFPTSIEEFRTNDLERVLEEEFKKEIMEGMKKVR